jgi:hypothetical protein
MLAHPGSGGGASGRHAATGGGGPKPGTRTRWMAAPSGARIVRSSVATRATIPAAAGPRSGLHSTPPTRLLKPPGGRLTRRSPFPRLPSAAASRACTQTDAGDHRARRHHHPFVGPASLLDLVRLGSAALDVRRERVVADLPDVSCSTSWAASSIAEQAPMPACGDSVCRRAALTPAGDELRSCRPALTRHLLTGAERSRRLRMSGSRGGCGACGMAARAARGAPRPVRLLGWRLLAAPAPLVGELGGELAHDVAWRSLEFVQPGSLGPRRLVP